MAEQDWLAERFEENRPRLRAVAYRMLGSADEADDAVQEAWLRLSRTDAEAVRSLPAWLTTVVARISLNMLRIRGHPARAPARRRTRCRRCGSCRDDPEEAAVLADSVGLALLVVLETLTPAERLAFVLHDMFDVPFDEIATIVDKSPAATRQLASRARRRVRGLSRRSPTCPGSVASSTPTSPRPGTATSKGWSACWIPTSCSGWTPRRCRPAAGWCCVVARPSPAERSRRRPGRAPASWPSSTGRWGW